MGRSVETVSDYVVYFDCSYMYEIEGDDWSFSELIDNLQYGLTAKYKSLARTKDKWVSHPYRENEIILENDHVQISISEYCGCGAVSVFVNPDNEDYQPYNITLAEHWLDQCWPGIMEIIEQYVIALNRLGTFSNGIGVFEKKL